MNNRQRSKKKSKDPIAHKIIGLGNNVAKQGIAKKYGGIGLNLLNAEKRVYKPNMLKKRIYDPETKRWVRMKISASSLRIIDKLGIRGAMEYGKRRAEKLAK